MSEYLCITFCGEEPSPRAYKMAKGLKKYRNIKVKCICNYFHKDLFPDLFDEVINLTFLKNNEKYNFLSRVEKKISKRVPFYNWKIQHLLEKFDTDIFHCIAAPYDLPALIIKYSNKKNILDSHDFAGISSGIENLPKKLREMERYCFENIDGIVHKGPKFEIEYYRKYGYKIDCPELTYLDYCDEDFFMPINSHKLSEEDGELHLVFTGSISSDLKYKYKYYIPFAKKLAKQQIHFHIYPNPYGIRTLDVYKELDKKEKYFHFHKPVSYRELSREIAKYDYGWWINQKFQSPGSTVDKWKVGIGNKLSCYLEAGLPILVSDHLEWGKEIIEKNRIGQSIKPNEIDNIGKKIESVNYSTLKKNVFKAREKLSIKKQVSKLVNFYENLIKD